MRSPSRARNIAIAGCVAGAVVAVASFFLPKAADDMMRAVVFVGGLLLFIFGGVAALVSQGHTRSYTRFLHGRPELARWRVDEKTWEDFLAVDHQLHAMKGHRLNRLHVIKHRPPGPAEIVVGKWGVQVDGDLHNFDTPGMPAIEYVSRSTQYPYYLEMGFYFAEQSFPRDSCLRFPFPLSREAAAIKVQQYYQAFEASRAPQPALAVTRPRLIYGLGVAGLLLCLAVVAYGVVRYGAGERGEMAVGLLIGGFVGVIGLAAMLAVVFLYRRSALRQR